MCDQRSSWHLFEEGLKRTIYLIHGVIDDKITAMVLLGSMS